MFSSGFLNRRSEAATRRSQGRLFVPSSTSVPRALVISSFVFFLLLPILASAQTPVGAPFDIHAVAEPQQQDPRIASGGSGGFVVVWHAGGNEQVVARRFDGDGLPLDAGTLLVADPAEDRVQSPDVAMSDAGSFAVVWQEDYRVLNARRFAPTGAAQGPSFVVQTQTGEFGVDQLAPSIGMDAAGAFGVAWRSTSSDSGATWVKTFNSDGSPGAFSEVNSGAILFDTRERPDIAMAPTGEFLVAWDESSYSYPTRVATRPFHATGTPSAGETQLDPASGENQREPKTARLGSGEFVVAWSEADFYGFSGADWSQARSQRLTSAGIPTGSIVEIGDLFVTSIAALDNGGYVVVGDLSTETSQRDGIAGRLFDAAGAPIGELFTVVASGDGIRDGQVAALENGFVVTWADPSVDGILAQRYSLDAGPTPGGFSFLPGRGLPGLPPAIPTFGGGSLQDCEFIDIDGDGELEAVVEFAGAPAGTLIIRDLGDSDTDNDLIFVGTGAAPGSIDTSAGSYAASVDLDGDGELEIVIASPSLSPGTVIVRDAGDSDTDNDVVFVSTQDGGSVLGSGDLDGDGEAELVVIAPALSSTTTLSRDLGDVDTDLDVLFVGATAGANGAFGDLDGDGETEVVVEDSSLPAGSVHSRDLGDADTDNDVVFVSSFGGGGLVSLTDLDGDGEVEVLVADPEAASGTVTTGDLGDTDTDNDIVFVGGSGGFAGEIDLDNDGEMEAVYHDDNSPGGTVVTRDLGDADTDPDVVIVGTQGGGAAVASADLDGDGEQELVVEDTLASSGTVVSRDLGDSDTDLDVVFVAAVDGGMVVGSFDLDGDGEVEIIVLDGSASVGSVLTRDIGDSDTDDDVVFVGTDGGLPAFALDVDGDGELEVAVDAPSLSVGTVQTRDLGDADTDAEVIFFGLGNAGGGASGVVDLDGDGELEIVVESPDLSTGTALGRDLGDADTDDDVIFVAAFDNQGAAFAVDLDGDGELEIVVDDTSGTAGTVITRDLGDVDTDDDVVFVGTAGGGAVVAVADLDGDGEQEVAAEISTLAPGTVFTRDLGDADTDSDVIFVGGEIAGLVDLDFDGEQELVAGDPTSDQTVVTRDLSDVDTDNDVVFIGIQGGGTISCAVDLDGDGEREVLVESPTLSGGTAVTRDLGDADTDDDVVFAGVAAPTCVDDSFDDGTLDPSWSTDFIGDADLGGAVEAGGVLQLSGNGTSLYAGADDTVFLSRDDISGDFRMEVDVLDFPGQIGGTYFKAGLMVRSGLGDQDPRVMVQYAPDFGNSGRPALQFRYRQCAGCAGDGALGSNIFDVQLPVRLAIERVGDTYTAEYSVDGGQSWQRPRGGSQGSIFLPMGDPLIGVNVVSYDPAAVTVAELDDFQVCTP